MKKVKNYLETEIAKKKITRYRYWSIKDESGITICSSDDNPDGKNFGEWLDKIIADNVDAEVQVKYGTNEQSARNNPPFFIRINEEIEWIDPEEDESEVKVNGVPHKVDRNGNLNIHFPERAEQAQPIYNTFKTDMEIQLNGLRREYELKEEKWKLDLHNRMAEQNLKFKEMLISEKEARLREREAAIQAMEQELTEKQHEMQDNLKGYLKEVPSVLGGLVKDYLKGQGKKNSGLAGTEQKEEKPKPKRSRVKFSIATPETEEEEETEDEIQADLSAETLVQAEISRYEQYEQGRKQPPIIVHGEKETAPEAEQEQANEEEQETNSETQKTEENENL